MTELPQSLSMSARPPCPGKPDQLVVLLGNKLIGLDSILPVAMELKEESPDLDVTFMFLSGGAVPAVERNYALHRAIRATGRMVVLSRGDGKLASKAVAAARLARWTLRMARRPTLLLAPSELGRFPFSPLARAARRGGGAACIYCKPAYPGNPALNFVQGLKTVGRDTRWRDPGDAFLIYHPAQATDYASYTDAPPILLGTPRRFPAWQAYLGRLAADPGIRDEQGRDLTALRKPVIVVFYPGKVVIPFQRDDVRETFLNLLDALDKELPSAGVVVKPHPVCDLDTLRGDIARHPGLDVRVSHAHPQLLARIASLAISTTASNVMNDCYLEGLPVIETVHYRPEVLALGESLFPNAGRIGCPDDASLRAALHRIGAVGGFSPKPDESALIWPKPPKLGAALWDR